MERWLPGRGQGCNGQRVPWLLWVGILVLKKPQWFPLCTLQGGVSEECKQSARPRAPFTPQWGGRWPCSLSLAISVVLPATVLDPPRCPLLFVISIVGHSELDTRVPEPACSSPRSCTPSSTRGTFCAQPRALSVMLSLAEMPFLKVPGTGCSESSQHALVSA